MKLSDAIRLGAMMKPQTRDQLWAFGNVIYNETANFWNREKIASCALGAACDAVGARNEVELYGTYPELMERYVVHEGLNRQVIDVIILLNDRNFWSREKIADWLDKQQQAEAPQAQPTQELVEV